MGAIHVGEITVEALYDGTAGLKPEMWSGADWTDHRDLIDADGMIIVPVGGFLVRTGDRMVLLDAGIGPVVNPMFRGGALLASMAAAGVQPGEIDTIVISHLHSDHVGWLERDGEAVFSNATVHIGAADWAYFVEHEGDGPRRAARMRSVADHVTLIDDDATVAPGITTRATPGHTPGHTSTVISNGSERLIVLGDALHCPAQLTETEWTFLFDVDPELAVRTRQALLREAEEPATTLLPCHFPGMQAARLVAAEGRRHWVLG